MRNKISLVLLLLVLPIVASAENNSDVVRRVLQSLDELNPYKVEIEVVYEGSSILGFYEVDESQYYISVDQQELYGDDTTKFEVYQNRKEIIIDSVKPDYNGNILNNPATAFDAIRDHYDAEVVSDNKDVITVDLKPKTGGDMQESIELSISKSNMLPRSVVYKFGDEKIEIKVLSIAHLNSTITLFDSANYVDYEMIDFR